MISSDANSLGPILLRSGWIEGDVQHFDRLDETVKLMNPLRPPAGWVPLHWSSEPAGFSVVLRQTWFEAERMAGWLTRVAKVL